MRRKHSRLPAERMYIQNANLVQTRPHHKHLLRARPYRGELPTVAGLLLYPDAPVKMDTTSHIAFCPKAGIEHKRGDHASVKVSHLLNTDQGPPWALDTDKKPLGEDSANTSQKRAISKATEKAEEDELLSLYQTDFLPPSLEYRRATPALPQPDNIAINPALRIDLGTVQRQMYPAWPVLKHKRAGRETASRTGRSTTTKKQ